MTTIDIESAIDKAKFTHNANNCGPISQPCVLCGVGIHNDPWVYGVRTVGDSWVLTNDQSEGVLKPIGWSCWRKHQELLQGFVFIGLKNEKAVMLR